MIMIFILLCPFVCLCDISRLGARKPTVFSKGSAFAEPIREMLRKY
jgi:hypothetical protein